MGDVQVEDIVPNQGVDCRTPSPEGSVFSDWWHGEEEGGEEHDKENTQTNASSRKNSTCSNDSSGSSKLILCDGGKLAEESKTEVSGLVNLAFQSSGSNSGVSNGDVNNSNSSSNSSRNSYSSNSNSSSSNSSSFSRQMPEIPPRLPSGGGTGTARQRAIKSGNIVSSIPEVEISIPTSGNLAAFSADDMATFLRYLRLEDRLVNHLHRSGLDGRRFGRLKDSDLDSLMLKNPVLVFFRDRTAPAVTKKGKPRLPFIL